MLLESLKALIQAGHHALRVTCGESVTGYGISLVREGNLTFPALADLHLGGGSLQRVHLGGDSRLSAQLAGLVGETTADAGIEVLANRFLDQLLKQMEGDDPCGTVHRLEPGAINLSSRGLRSFGLKLETDAGQLFVLAEVPSRLEMETIGDSKFLRVMKDTYLPQEGGNRQTVDTAPDIENFLVFLRKMEVDVYFEIPGQGDVHYGCSGVLLDSGTFADVQGLKFCTDIAAVAPSGLKQGDEVRGIAGIGDRSLQFSMSYLGESSHKLIRGAKLPCAIFLPPAALTIAQRRLDFRISSAEGIPVELYDGSGTNESGPQENPGQAAVPLLRGALADLSFSGVRIIADETAACPGLELNRRVILDIRLPDLDGPLVLPGVVRRSTSRLVDRHRRQQEIGLQFLIIDEADRTAMDYIRQLVLAEQRSRLSRRLGVVGSTS